MRPTCADYSICRRISNCQLRALGGGYIGCCVGTSLSRTWRSGTYIQDDVCATRVKVTGYKDFRKAATDAAHIELSEGGMDAVVAWVSDITELREAYPNYFADTREFIKAMHIAMYPSPHGRLAQTS